YGEQLRAHYGLGVETTAQTKLTRDVVTKHTGSQEDECLVITGMSGRFGKAQNVSDLWQLLAEGESSVTSLAQRRQILDDGGAIPSSGWRCSVIEGERAFDNVFFDISPREAQWMDPRQRVLLEAAWHCLEDAGLVADERHKIGMFIGVEQGDYQLLTRGGGSITANHDGVLASRLAYFLNLSGPVMALNTACSSGLVAMHQGSMALRHGACDAVLVGAVNLMLTEQVQ
ncbi:polyketide synthase, partial [Pseudoalteromonas holothuriae]|uniref:beta-ketoacyl [acyl carrier protein] synthase domain-containing protein n=1 Tax=Pseudoalteromonas holothuriae TaxID=2963714 RepID=UPI0021BFC9ED